MKDLKKLKQKEINANASVFKEMAKQGMMTRYYKGKHALMKKKVIIQYFDTWEDADRAGELLYEDQIFSVHTVGKPHLIFIKVIDEDQIFSVRKVAKRLPLKTD